MLSLNAVILDFETRSKCDLTTDGADNYALDPTTEVLCCGFLFLTDGEMYAYDPTIEDLPDWVIVRLLDCAFYMAHNARFDKMIWECVAVADNDFPELDTDSWYCTSAQARVNALPASLDKAARAISGKNQKDRKGSALIRKFSIPRKADGEFNIQSNLDRAEMLDYCMKDVLATAEIVCNTRLLTPTEHEDWLINERINDRGLKVDVPLAEMAMQYAGAEQEALAVELTALTDGAVTKHSQHARIKKFILSEISDSVAESRILSEMTVYVKGVQKTSLAKDIRANILALADAGEISITDKAYDVIMCADEGNKSSVAKFKRMVGLADADDGRVRGVLIFAGAGQTLRYSSKGCQVHNFSRNCFSAAEALAIREAMQNSQPLEDVMLTLSKMLRPTIIPESGKCFVVGDWAAIEGRFLPWLAGCAGSEEVLDVFRRGEDIYMHTAERMGITDRQIGKVSTLSLGYQGGANAFNSMGRNYGIYFSEAKAKRIVEQWREANVWAVRFWKKLEQAAFRAMRKPDADFEAGRVSYRFVKGLMGGTLLCILPNGESIQYPKAKLENVETNFGTKTQVTYMKASINPAADAKEWPRGSLYGGILAENCIAEGSEVLTDSGWKNIEDVDCEDKVHDGVEFVNHGGLLFKGIQSCVMVDGVFMTPDHKVLTNEGWKTASQHPRPYRPEIRHVDSGGEKPYGRKKMALAILMRVRRELCKSKLRGIESGKTRRHPELRMLHKSSTECA